MFRIYSSFYKYVMCAVGDRLYLIQILNVFVGRRARIDHSPCFCRFLTHRVFSTQVRLSDHIARGGAEAPEGPFYKWPSLRPVLPGLLGGVGQARPAVPAVPVSVRQLPHHGGPPPQRPAGRPRRVRRRPHAPQLPLLRVQRVGLRLCFPLLLCVGQGGFLLLPSVLLDSGGFFHFGLFRRVSAAAAAFQQGNPLKAR